MSFYNAIQHHGRNALILRNNEVIGRGKISMVFDIHARVLMPKHLVEDLQITRLINNSNVISFHFFLKSGEFIQDKGIENGTLITTTPASGDASFKFKSHFQFKNYYALESNSVFKNVRVVDEHRLSLGLVPDNFKDVPGYACNILQFEKWLLDPEDIFGLNGDQ